MHYKTFDTHKYIKSLQETGFNEQQAEMLVKSLLESRDFDLSILATREQVADLKSELQKDIAATHEQISEVKSDLQKNIAQLDSKLSKEISEVKSELQKEIAATREQVTHVENKLQKEIAATRDEIKQSKVDMLKWIVPIFITILIAIFFK
jgi:phosphopantetheine adenylyltransferase